MDNALGNNLVAFGNKQLPAVGGPNLYVIDSSTAAGVIDRTISFGLIFRGHYIDVI